MTMLLIPPRFQRPGRPACPLDAARLEALALRYAARYATTRAKLAAYLQRKLSERGWEDAAAPDIDSVVLRFADRGYVDARGFAAARAGALLRGGYGRRRIGVALAAAGVDEHDRPAPADPVDALTAALVLARRKRIGPFAAEPHDRAARERAIGILVRGGHDLALARKIASAAPGSVIDPD